MGRPTMRAFGFRSAPACAAAGLCGLLAACAPGGASLTSHGQAETTIARSTPSGAILVLDFYYSVSPDCKSMGATNARVAAPPQHGVLLFDRFSDFPSFQPSDRRYLCNQQRQPGLRAMYQSAPGFTGADSAVINVVYPDDYVMQFTYNITVK